MKTIITLGLSLFITSMGFSQNAPIDFETGGIGAGWTWTTFENDSNPPLEIVNNPSIAAPNSSGKVAKFTAIQGGNPWAGCESAKGANPNIGTFTLTASNAVVKIMVYKSAISDVGVKFAKNDNSAIAEIKVPNTKINEWEELTFDFTSKIGTAESFDITQIIIFPEFITGGPNSRPSTTISYFDNITFSAGSALAEPTVAAETPTKPASDVISLFSNAYPNVPVDTWRTGWSSATLTETQVASNEVKKYTGLDFVGIEMIANPINITDMDLIEFDVWTPNSTSFRVKLVDGGTNGTIGGGDDVEHETTIVPTLNGWNHVSVPIASMTGLTSKSSIVQLIFASSPAGTSVAYLDNILFSKGGAAEPTEAAPTPTKDADNVISLFSNAYTNVPVDTWRTGWSAATLTETQIDSNDVKKYTALDFVGIETVANQIDITEMDSFEFDLWTPNSTAFRFKLVDAGADEVIGGGDDKEHELTVTPTTNGWNHISAAISSFTTLTTKSNIAQLIFASSPSGASIAYIDNVLFSKNGPTSVRKVQPELVGIYPNPSNGILNLSTKSLINEVAIFNSLGQVVYTATLNRASASIDISELPKGIYTVKAAVNGVDSFTKLIKE
jgi:hypothetical protein